MNLDIQSRLWLMHSLVGQEVYKRLVVRLARIAANEYVERGGPHPRWTHQKEVGADLPLEPNW